MTEITDLGNGHYAIAGELTFSTAGDVLEQSKEMFSDHTQLEVDLAGVTQSDSAGLALLLEWVNWAKHDVREIKYLNMPKEIRAIAEISEVEDLLQAGERWTGATP
ncbi:MAG: STAS domain-containing protein [Pseudomonadota bacterium]